MAEVLLRRPLFDAKNEADALDKIFKLCGTGDKDREKIRTRFCCRSGTPCEKSWPGIQNLPAVAQHRIEFPRHLPTWRKVFPVFRTHITVRGTRVIAMGHAGSCRVE